MWALGAEASALVEEVGNNSLLSSMSLEMCLIVILPFLVDRYSSPWIEKAEERNEIVATVRYCWKSEGEAGVWVG